MSYLTRTALLGFLTAIVFFSRIATADIVITEILYTADPTNLGGEFLELHNNGSASVEVGNWVITDAVDFTFPTGTSIEAGEYIVVARNKAEAETFYGVSVLGEYVGALSNGGDRILLQDDSLPRQVMDSVEYDDESPWAADADGGGMSLELIDVQSDNSIAESWGLGQPFSPGQANMPGVQGENGDLVITEIMYKPRREELREKFDRVNQGTYFEDSDDEFGEFVELLNITDEPVDLSGWAFTDGIAYTFPEGSTVDAGEYIIVTADPQITRQRHSLNSDHVFGPFESGELDDGGERVTLRNADSVVVDTVDYNDRAPWPTGPDENGYSLEILDPLSDNSSAANWRASSAEFPFPEIVFIEEEDNPEGWQRYTTFGEATSNRLYFFLVEPGEWLIDNITLTRLGGDVELIPNGTLDASDEGWDKVGNHETSFWSATEGIDGSGALHVVSTGVGQNLRNCVMIRRVDGVAPGDQYEFGLSYKPLSGSGVALVRLAGGGFENTLLEGGNMSDLTRDFSNGINPVGFWTFADANGNRLFGRSENWLSSIFGEGQPAWTPIPAEGEVTDNLLPGWCRSVGTAATGDFPEGAVGTHGPSQLIFTAPGLGIAKLTGGLYLMNRVENGDHRWTMSLNDVEISSGELLWQEDFSSSNPKPLASGSGGEEALEHLLQKGDEIIFSVSALPGNVDSVVGFDIQSEFQLGIEPRPPLSGTLGTGSPAQPNSLSSDGLPPFVRDLRHLVEKPRSTDAVSVIARLDSDSPLTSVELFYSLNIDTTSQSLPMVDDGTQQDGAAGDGVYGVTIPAQESQNIVHYWVRAEDSDGRVTTYPYDDDVSNTQAYFVFDNEIDTVLTTYHLWISSENQSAIRRDPRSNVYQNAHLAIDGIAYPNIGARFRGRGSRTHAKNQWKFQFHKNHLYKGNRVMDTMVNQPLNQHVVFDIMAQSGVVNINSELVRLHHNGPFWGVYVIFESPNSTWVRNRGYPEDTEVYKARSVETPGESKNSDLFPNQLRTDLDFWGAWNKKVRPLNPPSHIREFTEIVNTMPDADFLPWADKNIDLDQWLGRWALYILTNTDDFAGHNYYLMLLGGEDGKWQNLAYDFDSSYTYNRVGAISAFYGDGVGTSAAWQRNRFLRRVSSNQTLSRIYMFRLREVLEFYKESELFPPVQSLFSSTAVERSTERVRTMKGSLSEFTSVFRGQHARVTTTIQGRDLPGDAEIPTVSPDAGSFSGSVSVTLTALEGWLPVYTLDGTDPRLSADSFEYSEPIVLTETTLLRTAAIEVHRDTGEPLYNLGLWTEVSDFLFEKSAVTAAGPFVRGDCNGDGVAGGDVSDAVAMLVFVLAGGTSPACQAACDADASTVVDISDALYLLEHSYLGSPAPPAPYPACGTSTGEGDLALGCDNASACAQP